MNEPTTATDWETRARIAGARVEELTAERARLWEELHALQAERRTIDHYEALTDYMEHSLSWRVTSPLRAFKRLTIRLKRALDQRD